MYEWAICVFGLGISGIAAAVYINVVRSREEGLNYRTELRAKADSGQPVESNGDWWMEIVKFVSTPEGQQVLEQVLLALKAKQN